MAAPSFFPPRASRSAALDRLADFVPRAGRAYARDRNYDRGADARENVSTLSPYLRHRLVTEHEVVGAVLAAHPLASAEKFVQEVYWRTYWKGWLELRPSVWHGYLAAIEPERDALSVEQRFTYEAAVAGLTGIEGFDDWARELVEVGYLHNHARMWFASIWIFTLRLPWQLGADFFLRHLLDGDPASNTLSWRWVAGLQTVGKTYLATPDNIERYTDGRFRPRGLATEAVALVDDVPIPPAAPAPLPEPLPTSAARVGLLLHEDDLAVESLQLGGAAIGALAVAGSGAVPSPLTAHPVTDAVRTFSDDALRDAAERAASATGCTPAPVDLADPGAVLAWAREHELDHVATPYAPTGPGRDRLEPALAALRNAGVGTTALLRSWDARAWPHARRGFFPFKERIPALLREAGITPHPS